MRLKKFLTYFFVFILIFGAYLFGYLVGHQNLVFEKAYIPKIENLELKKPADIDFSLFWDVWNKIEEKYVGPIDKWKMFYGAISGMVQGVGDPYTVFLNPEDSKKFLEEMKGEFEGIGVELALKKNRLTVVAPLEDSPARSAGLKPGDIIEKIDQKEASLLSLEEAISLIRGKRGTEVNLVIKREGVEKPLEFKIKRALIKIKSVKWEMEDSLAYIKVSQFLEETTPSLQKATNEILKKNPKGIILDLRNNPGGYLDGAIDLASFFIKEGVIAIEEGKDGKKEEFKAKGGARLSDFPLVVLINAGSASGSEIVAGAIQDRKRGLLIGEKTFGKGLVQSFEELKGGSSLRISVAKWLTPLSRSINEVGLSPDIEVKMTEEDEKAGKDPQLERAIKELSK